MQNLIAFVAAVNVSWELFPVVKAVIIFSHLQNLHSSCKSFGS